MGRVGNIDNIELNTSGGDNSTDVKVDLGGGHRIIAPQAAPPGMDVRPMPDDLVVTTSVPGGSGQIVIGYIDMHNAGQTASGDGPRLYSRDAGYNQVATIETKATGEIALTSPLASVVIAPNGAVTVSAGPTGAITMLPDGTITLSSGPGNIIISAAGAVSINGKLTIGP